MKLYIAHLSHSHVLRPYDLDDFLAPGSKPTYIPMKYAEGWRRAAERMLKRRPELEGGKAVICLQGEK